MKNNLPLLVLCLAGCQAPLPAVRPLPDPFPLREPASHYVRNENRAPATPPSEPREAKNRNDQRPMIEALIAQNDALTARIRELEKAAKTTVDSGSHGVASVPAIGAPPVADSSWLTANADGVIDATANKTGGSANPFAVRTVAADGIREIKLDVQALTGGAQPCALVNGRVVQVGDAIESLRFSRITPEMLIVNGDGFAASLPLGSTKVRVAL